MKLKKLELFGFKSFADREEFLFEPGITVIVGPNGCGKSNVFDSIKWILGEQSAKSLRGSEMSDIIFGGSGSRPAVSFAEASLTFSNEENLLPIEYKEVSISRRLYTSGESEYLINKNICRLKEIKELFLGTGVGVNSYSIIEQGKVEAMLQANAHERRCVFEEAAGISKYKSRKREALLKLEKTRQNLLRINDIINEVEKQLRSIKIQATKARKYKEYCKRLQKLKIILSLKNFRDLKSKKDDVIKEINLLSKTREDVLSALDSMEVEAMDFENQLSCIDQKTSEANAEIITINARIANTMDKMNFCKERLKDLELQESNCNDEAKTLKRKIEENEINFINIKKDLDVVEQNAIRDSESLVSSETKFEQIILEADMLAEKIEEKKSKIMDIFHDQSKTQNEIGNQTTINETLKNRRYKIEKTQSDILNQIDLIGKNIQGLKDKYSELMMKTKNLLNERSCLKNSIDILNNEISGYDHAISRQEKIRSGKQSRLEVLEDYEMRSEGVDAGAKAILDEVISKKESFAGIYGLVADIIKVELPFARAVETTLGDLAQSVVTKSYEDSIRAINFLKETNAGHATFLLIDRINDCQWAIIDDCRLNETDSLTNNEDLQSNNQQSTLNNLETLLTNQQSAFYEGIIGKASELVKHDDEFKAIVDHLLDKTLIVQDFNKAVSLINDIYQNNGSMNLLKTRYGNINRIVTLDGALIEKPGIIKGGVIREKPGLILRKSEMESIRADLLDIDHEINKLQGEKHLKIDKLNKTKESLDLTTQKVEELNILSLNNENEQKQECQRRSKLVEENDVNTSELKEIEQSIDSIAKRDMELRNKLYMLNEQRNGLEEEVSIISEEITGKDELKSVVQKEIIDLKVTIAQKSERKETLIQTLQQTEINGKESKNQLNSKFSGIEECKKKKQKTLSELEESGQHLKDFDSKKGITEDLLNTLVDDRNNVFSRLSDIRTDVGNYKVRHSDLEDQLHKLRLKENEYQVRMADLEDRIFEEYNIRLSEFDELQLRSEGYNYPSGNNTMVKSMERDGMEGFIEITDAQTTDVQDNNNYGPFISFQNTKDNENNPAIPTFSKGEREGLSGENEMATAINDTKTDWNAVNIEIEELKWKIEKIGGVNLDSIKEQEEFEERCQFLTNQRNDLERSEKSLNDIIEKLNHTSRELFKKTFNDIKENFYIYFRKLFGGGRANIVLEEGADILEAGIEIIIQPPNKEFKSITLFSGGEKVLITVALLFAILKAKPAPFCLMDEVDAALDENNIDRFTAVLKEFTLDLQFIIVTHNKKTMNIADVIYGITMEESGVSKKVAVKFDKFE